MNFEELISAMRRRGVQNVIVFPSGKMNAVMQWGVVRFESIREVESWVKEEIQSENEQPNGVS